MRDWIKETAIKAIKTMAQTAVAMLTAGQAVIDVNWKNVLLVSITAGIMSVLTSIASIPTKGDDLESIYDTIRKAEDDEQA